MSRKFQDESFLVWEAYPSAGRFGFSKNPYLIFNCLSDRQLRPRMVEQAGDEAEAERVIVNATPQQLIELLLKSHEVR
jgi:hypothetical protein